MFLIGGAMGGRGASSRTSAAGGVMGIPKMPERPTGGTEEQRSAYREERERVLREIDAMAARAYAAAPSMGMDEAERAAARSGMELDRESLSAMDPKSVGVLVTTTADLLDRYPVVKRAYDSAGVRFRLTGKAQRGNDADSSGGINLGAAFADYRGEASSYMQSVSRGVLVNGDGTPRTTVRHEFGHELHSALHSSLSDSSYKKMTDAAVSLARSHGSEYSRTDRYEAFAEGFAEYESNPRSSYGREFGKLLRKYV